MSIRVERRSGRGAVGAAVGMLASLALASGALAPGVASAAALNVTGTWQAVYHCTSGSCAGEAKSGTFKLTQVEGQSAVTGTLVLNVGEGAEGTLTGNTLELNGVGAKGYEAKGTEEISEDGQSWNGDYMDNHGTSGTLTATREATTPTPSPPPTTTPSGLRPSGTQVLCNLEVAFSNFTCTAQVGDASAQNPPKIPTGTVNFTAPRGAFEPLGACALKATPSSANVSSCAVTYVPPFAGIPTGTPAPVTAAYVGDTVFAPSTGLPGAGAGISPNATPVKSGPSEVSTTVSCPTGTSSCSVTANLSVIEEGKAIVAKKVAAKKAKPKTVTIGGTEVTLRPGQKKKISVKLNAAGRKLLKTHKHLTALFQVSSGGIVIENKKVQIKPPGNGGHRGKRR